MYVCVYVCMYVYVYVCVISVESYWTVENGVLVLTLMKVCIMCVCMYPMHAYVCMYMHACMHTCMYVCVYVCMYACMYVCVCVCMCDP